MEVDSATRVREDGIPPLSVEEVDRIVTSRDPYLRNLWITYTYHRLSATLAARLPGHANWCTFATWASKQAGQTIRGEDLLPLLDDLIDAPEEAAGWFARLWRRALRRSLSGQDTFSSRLFYHLLDPFALLRRTSEAVARGNLKVFDEIGRVFAMFLPLCAGTAPTPAAVAAFCERLRSGEAPEGQQHLRSAFTHYGLALATDDPTLRAQLMLLANLEIGLHEQTRLQPEIREALDVPGTTFTALGQRILEAFRPRLATRAASVRLPVAFGLGIILAPVAYLLRQSFRLLVTELLMVLYLPGAGRLRLGRDLQAPIPEVFRTASHPDLKALLERIVSPAGRPDRTGACDWSVLPERMYYILHLFRAFHAEPLLLSAPFTEIQLAALHRGMLPEGRL